MTVIKGYNSGTSAWEPVAVGADITNTLTTKGDLLGRTSSAASRLGVGSNNQVLTADSAEATGLKWATPAAGGMTLLSTTSLSGTSTTISSISQDYTNLMVIINNPFFNSGAILRVNPNSTANISEQGRITNSGAATNTNIISSSNNFLPTTSTPLNTFCLQIFNYTQTTNGKNFYFSGSQFGEDMVFGGGAIRTTSAITALQFTTQAGTSTFSGGTVLIYGVK